MNNMNNLAELKLTLQLMGFNPQSVFYNSPDEFDDSILSIVHVVEEVGDAVKENQAAQLWLRENFFKVKETAGENFKTFSLVDGRIAVIEIFHYTNVPQSPLRKL